MVLKPNFAVRNPSNAENLPPSATKPTVSRLLSSLSDAARRRRARTSGSPKASKYTVEQAKRRSQTKSSPTLKLKAAPEPAAVHTVEAKDSTSTPLGQQITLPKKLGRPQFVEVSKDALVAIDPALDEIHIDFIRDSLVQFGPEMLNGLATVKANPAKDALPKELDIVMQDPSAVPPSHMLAVYGPPVPNVPRRKVTLYPVHSIILSAYCAKLPAFHATDSIPSSLNTGSYTVPVRPVCLPSPSNYLRLATFLYTKRADVLFCSVMPPANKPPASLLSSLGLPSREDVSQYSSALAETCTPQILLQHALVLQGLWQNVCALGVFDARLWGVLDVAWKVLLTAIATSTGNPGAMTEPDN